MPSYIFKQPYLSKYIFADIQIGSSNDYYTITKTLDIYPRN